jgi:hypothetical protein
MLSHPAGLQSAGRMVSRPVSEMRGKSEEVVPQPVQSKCGRPRSTPRTGEKEEAGKRRLAHVPSHLPHLVGRNRRALGSPAKADAPRRHFNDHDVRKLSDEGQAQG